MQASVIHIHACMAIYFFRYNRLAIMANQGPMHSGDGTATAVAQTIHDPPQETPATPALEEAPAPEEAERAAGTVAVGLKACNTKCKLVLYIQVHAWPYRFFDTTEWPSWPTKDPCMHDMDCDSRGTSDGKK